MTRKAGSIVINRLRDRIRLGRYFGRWRPGDRLPSVREVATLEKVDRKTAAAAYRRLEREGLVRVEPRSGVYLREPAEAGPDPLGRLHLQWLERTMASAGKLGLSAETVARMFQAVLAVQQRRIPVVDPDPEHASLLAREIARRTGLDCVGAQPDRFPARAGPLRDPPFLIGTPRGLDAVKSVGRRVPRVTIDLAAGLFEELCEAAASGDRVLVVVGSGGLKAELEAALERGLGAHPERVEVVRTGGKEDGTRADGASRRVFIWTAPGSVDGGPADGAERPSEFVSESTIERIRCEVARAALDQVSRSNAYATRG